jgi:hypothetical protein
VERFALRRNTGFKDESSELPLAIEEIPATRGADRAGRHKAVQLPMGELLNVEHQGHSIWGRGSLRFERRLQAGSSRSTVSRR